MICVQQNLKNIGEFNVLRSKPARTAIETLFQNKLSVIVIVSFHKWYFVRNSRGNISFLSYYEVLGFFEDVKGHFIDFQRNQNTRVYKQLIEIGIQSVSALIFDITF